MLAARCGISYHHSMKKSDSILSSQTALDDVMSRFATAEMVAIDTEFMREKTYYPDLCLIQIAALGESYIIDPIAYELDLTSFWDLLQNESVVKAFHAGRQDIEIFYLKTGKVPSPLFDSQIAAMVCGLGDQVGYDKLVQHFLKKHIDKSSRFTDWSKRPLSDKQIHYALDDVIYLEQIYPLLKEALRDGHKEEWITEEMAILAKDSTYSAIPEEMYKKLKLRSPKPITLNRLKFLAAFREQECQKRNLPRSRFLKDETLIDLAASAPKTKEALQKIRGLRINGSGWLSDQLLKVIQTADKVDKEDWPTPAKQKQIDRAPTAVLEMFRVLLKSVSDETGAAPRLIATASDLELLAQSDDPHQAVLQGWRYELFGKQAQALKAGKIAMTLQDNKICFHALSELSLTESN